MEEQGMKRMICFVTKYHENKLSKNLRPNGAYFAKDIDDFAKNITDDCFPVIALSKTRGKYKKVSSIMNMFKSIEFHFLYLGKGGEGNMLYQYLKLLDEENSDAILYGVSDIMHLIKS
jgi:hypothetical protein